MVEAWLPARIGTLLASPQRAMAEVDRRGGGVRDAAWVAVLATVCLKLADFERALIGWDVAVFAAVRHALMVLARELRWPVVFGAVAGLVITALAGRRHRDPSKDAELGAACCVPFFAARALILTFRLDRFLGASVYAVDQVATLVALFWVVVGVATARGRGGGAASAARITGSLRDRIAVTSFAVVLGVAIVLNIAVVVRAGRTAPNFSLPRVDAPGRLALADLRGKVVLLDFWATWCGPCTMMAQPLSELYTELHPSGVEFVGINSDGPGVSVDEIREHLKAHPAPYPIVIDDEEVGGRYNVVALPHMVVLGRDGEIRKVFMGVTTRGELAAALRRAAN